MGILTLVQEQRFPKPEFQSGYEVPETVIPQPDSFLMDYLDVGLLVLVMSLTAWFIFKKRSRKGILWLSVFSLAYFGFFREGCICSVGSIQNMALALFGEGYAVPFTVILTFAIPLLFALVMGRLFCASACPLGVIQDLVIVKAVKVAPWIQKSLGLFPFVYLSFAVLYAATGTDFIICKFDPFVGFFRLGAEFHMLVLGVAFLLIGMFVARPYCRFVCPYGALLKTFSRLSFKHLSITPKECISCKLCKDSCPFDAIEFPSDEKTNKPTNADFKRFVWYLVLIPVIMLLLGWAVSGSYRLLASVHPDVAMVQLLKTDPAALSSKGNLDVDTFLASGRTVAELQKDAQVVLDAFKMGGWYAGGFIGLVIGLFLLGEVTYKKKEIYQADRANCFSCGRCMDYCPVGKPEHPYHRLKNEEDGKEAQTD